LDIIFQTYWNKVIDEIQLPSLDRWTKGRNQQIVGKLLMTLCEDATQFSYSLQKFFATSYSPSKLMNGKQLITAHMVMKGYYENNPTTLGLMTNWEDQLDFTRVHFTNVRGRMKHWEYQERHNVHLNIRDWVSVRLIRNQFTPPTGIAPSLVQRYKGSFKILEKIEEVTYKLELLFHMRSHHPIFHINQLKPF
jgi:hypothetical protein